ncbi:hypothetical protein BASA81_011106 [Batrachochytrium salamandrivorans]|nr:hypothetical protein BASA81_011106 [Batrachochytrium salamandrivorans]
MEGIITKLNSDEIPELTAGLRELEERVDLHQTYINASPLANELVQIWELAHRQSDVLGNAGVEELCLANLAGLLASTETKSAQRLAQHLLQSTFAFPRLRNLVERKQKNAQESCLLAFQVVTCIATLDSHLARELQYRLDFKNLVAHELSAKQTVALATLWGRFLAQQQTGASKRQLLESSLGAYVLERLQEVSLEMLDSVVLPHLQLSAIVTPALIKCMQFHPDVVARERVLAVTLDLIKATGHDNKARMVVMDAVEPFSDFAHAEVFAQCLHGVSKKYAADVVARKLKRCKFEPRNSFHWFKMVSLLCRFLDDDAVTVDIPEELLTRQMLVRGLLFNGNALVKLFTLDLLAHLLVGLGKTTPSREVLLRRLPEVSLLMSFQALYQRTRTEQDQILYLRSLRVLELYAKLNLLSKFDPMRFLPASDDDAGEYTNAVVWYHVVRLIAASNVDKDLWLKVVDDNSNTVLGKVLQAYCYPPTASLAQETKDTLEYLLCLAFQGIAKSTLLDVVEVCGEEKLVTQTSKRIVRFAMRGESELKQVQASLLRLKKERNAGFDSAAFALPYPNSKVQLGLTLPQLDLLITKTRKCDWAEELASPLGGLVATVGNWDSALRILFSRLVNAFAKQPTKLSTLNNVHAMLSMRPVLPLDLVLELNLVLNSLYKSPFPLAQHVLGDVQYYFVAPTFLLDKTHTSRTRALALCNPLSTQDRRLVLARELLQAKDFEAFAPLVEYDNHLLLHPAVFEVMFASLQVKWLQQAVEQFPAEASFLANRFPKSVDQLVSQSQNNHELRKLANLFSQLPGIFSLLMSQEKQPPVGFTTCSYHLTLARANADSNELDCTMQVASLLDVLPQTEAFATLVLENFDQLGLNKLKQFTSKRLIAKSVAKRFAAITLEEMADKPSGQRIQALSYLVEMKRLKPHRLLATLLAWPHLSLYHSAQAELLYRVLQRVVEEEEEEVDWNALLLVVLPAYQAMLTKKDLFLRQVLHLIEAKFPMALVGKGFSFGTQLVNGKALVHGGLQDVLYALQNCTWVLDSLDGRKLRMKAELNRGLVPEITEDPSFSDGYDPSFMLRALNFVLALHALDTKLPSTSVTKGNEPNEYVDDNEKGEDTLLFQPKRWILGGQMDYILHYLASNSLEVRMESYACVQRFAQLLARTPGATTPFRDDVLVLLRALKSGISTPHEQLSPLITTYACEFLQTLCRGSMHNTLHYRIATRFLFSSTDSGWRLGDIPLFYETVNSGSVLDFQAERAFTLGMLMRGVLTKQDITILHKRHCLEIALTMFHTPMSDMPTKRLILKLIHQVATIKNGGALEVLRNGFMVFALGVIGECARDRDAMELAIKCSEILKLLAQARAPLFARVRERDSKRLKLSQRVGEQWFLRCEWSCDEAEMQFASQSICQAVMTTACGDGKEDDGALFANLLEVLLAQRGFLRLSCEELMRLINANATTIGKLLELVLGSTSLQVTTRQDLLPFGAELFGFMIKHHNQHGKHQRAVFAWLCEVAQLAPELLPVRELLACYNTAELEWMAELNQTCMIALSAMRCTGQFAKKAQTKLVPDLLAKVGGCLETDKGQALRDLFPLLLHEALTDSEDGLAYYAFVNRLA